MNLRLVAAEIIDEVTEGRSLSDCLEDVLPTIRDSRDRAFVQAICFGVCRYYTRLDVILSFLLKKPLKAKESIVHALLLVGLYQILEMRVPPHAAVAETVNAVDELRKPWAKGLVNAILREFLRHSETFISESEEDIEAQYAHPLWWIEKIKEAWPVQWEAILDANNAHPPFSLRVNGLVTNRDAYLEKLATDNKAHAIPFTTHGIMLDEPMAVESLPGYLGGEIAVQDGAAQLAAPLLDLKEGQVVLDACAAPGGKLLHLLAEEPGLSKVVAVEKDRRRLDSIKENLVRLSKDQKEKVILQAKDAKKVDAWWDGELFDRILLDAPCSASGVIRRHPDIKLLRDPADIEDLAHEQSEILEALWKTLKPGGLLVYATCSIFPEENTLVLKRFLETHPDASEEKITAEWGVPVEIGRQILPGEHGLDGFYYARLKKECSGKTELSTQ